MKDKTHLVRVKLVQGRSLACESPVSGACSLAATLRRLLRDQDREQFVVVHLDKKHHVLSIEVVATGTLDAVLVHPREVYKGALLANAAAIALAHNHPSGDTAPSPEDLALTATLIEAGRVLGVQVVDHLVLGDGYTSLRERHADLAWGA